MSPDPFALDLEHIEEILPRYTTEGPRYTSYPTAPVWTERFGPEEQRAELARDDVRESDGLSLYVHVPFCRSLCHFCACNKKITRDYGEARRYLDAIEREIEALRVAVGVPRSATQVHWGGGTPTYLEPADIRRLQGALSAAFPFRPEAEISIEVDPRVTRDEHVAALAECGWNRLSMGVQDFDPAVQEAIHRIQPAEQTARLVEQARSAGFRSVGFDLIYGLPHQSEESFRRTLDAVIEISPDRIALYSYAHVTWVAKQQRGFERIHLPEARTKLRIMLAAIRRFLAEGYVFVGLDHFAKPDDELAQALADRSLRRNFMGHTTQAGVDLLGFGPSAISELRGAYAQSHREPRAWAEAVGEGGLATLRGHRLSADDVERRWIINRILCLGELRAEEHRERFGGELSQRFAAELGALAPAEEDGLIERDADGSLRVTSVGRLFARNLAMAFDAYLAEQKKAGRQLFSKTV